MLSGPEIKRQIELGTIEIDPFNPQFCGPNSVDLHVGHKLLAYSEVDKELIEVKRGRFYERVRAINSRAPPPVVEVPFVKTQYGPGWLIMPNKGYLGRTIERVCAQGYVPVIDGRSTYGRLFMWCHVTAGLGDDAFDGTFTLEIGASEPMILYPGDRICQVLFHPVVGERQPYTGQYQNQVEPTPAGPAVALLHALQSAAEKLP